MRKTDKKLFVEILACCGVLGLVVLVYVWVYSIISFIAKDTLKEEIDKIHEEIKALKTTSSTNYYDKWLYSGSHDITALPSTTGMMHYKNCVKWEDVK